MPILSKAAILAAKDLVTESVHVPEWQGEVLVRTLTAAELDQYQTSMLQQRGKSQVANLENIRSKLVAMTVVDEDGQRLFTDSDVKALSGKSGSAVNRIFEVAQRLSGLSNDAVDEMAEALEADPLEGSHSA
jgi:hypothetical protein